MCKTSGSCSIHCVSTYRGSQPHQTTNHEKLKIVAEAIAGAMQPDSTRVLSPVLYIPHGGGPMPLLGDPDHKDMVEFLSTIGSRFARPSGILVISAHWEAKQPTITGGESPGLLYDYYGFPEESYRIQYPAPGHPELAREMHRLLRENGIEAHVDDRRGFDHGLFVPLKIMYPDASIPCVQMSLVSGLDPGVHIRLGQALATLRTQNVLILGSGFSFHNMSAFFSSSPDATDSRNEAFQQWLLDTCTRTNIPAEERQRRLIDWELAPSARYCHPREEHLMPLFVCYGCAGSSAAIVFDGMVLKKRALGLLW